MQNNNQLIKLNTLLQKVPYSKPSIYRLMAEGKFPKSVNLGGRSVFWVETEIDEFIQNSINQSKEAA
jgi:prophage regulatory protein